MMKNPRGSANFKLFFLGKGDEHGCEAVEEALNEFVKDKTTLSWDLKAGSFEPLGRQGRENEEFPPQMAGAVIVLCYEKTESKDPSVFTVVFAGRSSKSKESAGELMNKNEEGRALVDYKTAVASYETTFAFDEEREPSPSLGTFVVIERR